MQKGFGRLVNYIYVYHISEQTVNRKAWRDGSTLKPNSTLYLPVSKIEKYPSTTSFHERNVSGPMTRQPNTFLLFDRYQKPRLCS